MSVVDRLTLFFPAYDEALNVGACIDAARHAIAGLSLVDWEILFVDDGSTDGTSEVILRHAKDEPRIRVVRHPENRGYGAAVRTGIAEARHPWFFMTDADLQFRMDDLASLVPLADRCTFVQGRRANRADERSRVVLGDVYRRVVHAAASVPVRDPECSFRLVRTDLLKGLTLSSRGPLVPVELVVRAARAGAVFGEVGVPHYPRRHGASKALSLHSVAMLARDVLAIAAEVVTHRSPTA